MFETRKTKLSEVNKMSEYELINEDVKSDKCEYCMFGVIVKLEESDLYGCNTCGKKFKLKSEVKKPTSEKPDISS